MEQLFLNIYFCCGRMKMEAGIMREFKGYTRGINLGGWLSQADETTKEHYDSFITEADIKAIAEMGLDHVRLPVDYTLIESEQGEMIEEGYVWIDRAVRWCEEYGLNILIDMHNTFGYTFDPLAKDADREIFFHEEALQNRFYTMWDRVSSRYGRRSNTAFELLNEVVSPNVVQEWNEIISRAIDVIRKNAPEAWIVAGGVRYNNVTSVPMLDRPKDEHIVYNFHCYEPLVFTHQAAYWVEHMPEDFRADYPLRAGEYASLSEPFADEMVQAIRRVNPDSKGVNIFEELFAPAVEAAERNNAPLYCGEYGVIDRAPDDAAVRWMRDIHAVFEAHAIGRALWNYKQKDFGLIDPHYDRVRSEIIQYL